MNIIDIILISILVLSVIYAAFRGFVHSMLSLGASILSFFLAHALVPSIVKRIASNINIVNIIKYYTDTASKISDLGFVSSDATINTSAISSIFDRLQLASPLDIIVKANVKEKVISGSTELNEIISKTIITVAINILAFIICFFVIFLMISIIISLLNSVLRYPQLKHGDMVLSIILGIARGTIFLFVLCTIIPILRTIIPIEEIRLLFNQSEYLSLFSNATLILRIIN